MPIQRYPQVRHTYDIVNSNGECTTTVVFGEVRVNPINTAVYGFGACYCLKLLSIPYSRTVRIECTVVAYAIVRALFAARNQIPSTAESQVVMFHVLPHLLSEAGAGEGKPTVNLKGYKPMARLGGNTYATLGSIFDLRRPSVN